LPRTRTLSAEVVVVGAGVSGLAAAHRLLERGIESVVVVEAAERVGGRTWNRPLRTGGVIEGGAMYVCPSQRDIWRLVEVFGLELVPMHKGGVHVTELGGERRLGHRVAQDAYDELRQAIRAFDELVAGVCVDEPWRHPDAAVLDAISLAQWRDERVSHPVARVLFDRSVTGWLATPASRSSLLYALHHAATCGGVAGMLADHATIYRFRGGSQRLALAIAERLGERLLLGTPVRAVEDGPDGRVRVATSHVDVVADHVIVALNALGIRGIDFSPDLGRDLLARSWQPGHLVKVNVVYPEPFWRADGLSGSASCDTGPFPAAVDSSPEDGSSGILTLIGFVHPQGEPFGNPPRFFADPEARRAAALDCLARWFGPQALTPVEYQETNWAQQPWIFGCQGALPPGVLTQVGPALRRPVGRVHFAGTETATRWTGWMNGAVQAGERAADEVTTAR
jgi:monoamine oxidase